jgi:hypothetical protein
MPDVSGVTVATNARVFYHHARLRAHRAPGIPCALDIEGQRSAITRAFDVAGTWARVIASDGGSSLTLRAMTV